VPQLAIDKSCETDCICGRLSLPAKHIREVDLLLMIKWAEIPFNYTDDKIPRDLETQLVRFINSQIAKNTFKIVIPYTPVEISIVQEVDPLVVAFEDGTLNVKEFNHRKHLYIAWVYLKTMKLDVAVERYMTYLKPLLESAGQSFRLSLPVTRAYFTRLDVAMKEYSAETFDELVEKSPNVLSKISA
jgi:hypothetical protein